MRFMPTAANAILTVYCIEISSYSLPTPLTRSTLAVALKPAIASKQYGFEDKLSELVAEAALVVMPPNPKNFNVDNVRVVKIMGGDFSMSKVVKGMVFGREPEGIMRIYRSRRRAHHRLGVVKKAKKAKVAVYTSALDVSQTETKGTVLIKNANEMLNFTTGEEKQLEKVLHLLYASLGLPNAALFLDYQGNC